MAGGIYEQSEWPDSRWDCVTVCDGCHTVVWSTRWDEETTDGVDADLARNGWRHYCLRDELGCWTSARNARHAPAPRRDPHSCRLLDPPGARLQARRPGG